ncbi:histidinol-phosphate transaminase [Nodosilinea sp. LEGE 06152]|uniref:histidinol-phosphate transaminase n=1 Tax=Nodosilinea sp. LEGE 06152 TaxID=2777966 RepID=UPI0018802333|nr:histidinol-phosphate transaminase [Nodosilinea sp. LEGE 06152]MBE9158473.1 histidinol-phosphate transaminase [Nodosilinea sp. LEGE 06152]MBE9160415.1 histidinol-phosphate transaminase [Nodosilinea sp. LEGE 06152]
MSLPFLRSAVVQLAAYTPHVESADDPSPAALDILDTNECPYDLPKALKEKLAWQLHNDIAANRYPDGGHGALKEAIAQYVTETAAGASFSADHISVGNGSDELIRSLLIATCLGGAGSVLVADPTFSMYGILARTLGIPVITVGRSEDTFEVDLSAAQQAIGHPQTPPVRVVFMVHPNSPTGNALTAAEVAWLEALPSDILVVVDEAYFEFSQQTTVANVLTRPNWVVMRTFSKAFRLAAYRVGYAVANPALAQALEKVRLPYNLPSLTQAAAQLALAHRQELLAVVTEIQQQRRELASAIAQNTPLRLWPSDANFLYGRPPAQPEQPLKTELERWFNRLRVQGTLVRHTGGGLRITIGTPEENQRTLAHLQQV